MFLIKREGVTITQPVRVVEDNDEEIVVGERPEINKTARPPDKNYNNGLKPVVYLQIIVILLLLLNIATMIGWFDEEEPLIAWDIDLNIESDENYGSIYRGELNLKNIGGKTTWINVWGDVYKSDNDPEPGEEMVKVLNGFNSEIRPGQKTSVDLGSFIVDNDFIYSVRVYIQWSGGSFRWAKILTHED